VSGSCLCGAVTYEVSKLFLSFVHCHCSRCCKATGSAHASNLRVPPDQFSWTSGQEKTSADFSGDLTGSMQELVRDVEKKRVSVRCGSLQGSEAHKPVAASNIQGGFARLDSSEIERCVAMVSELAEAQASGVAVLGSAEAFLQQPTQPNCPACRHSTV
jgi:hypothetical protein